MMGLALAGFGGAVIGFVVAWVVRGVIQEAEDAVLNPAPSDPWSDRKAELAKAHLAGVTEGRALADDLIAEAESGRRAAEAALAFRIARRSEASKRGAQTRKARGQGDAA